MSAQAQSTATPRLSAWRRFGLDGLVAHVRRRRSAALTALILDFCETKGHCRIIDLGGEPGYWRNLDLAALRAAGASILLVNTTAQAADAGIETLAADACDLSRFGAGAFDLAHSNSVIEHVGEWDRMVAFAGELRRLAPSYYVQTPYFWFPIEPHFLSPGFHWTPETSRVRAMLRRDHGHFPRAASVSEAIEIVRSARLLDRTQFEFLFPDAEHGVERFGGLVKSLIAVRRGV
jgi:hypothetical protein